MEFHYYVKAAHVVTLGLFTGTQLAPGTFAQEGAGTPGQRSCLRIAFSVEYHGPTIAMSESFFGFPITAGDILTPAGGGPPGPNLPGFEPLLTPGVQVGGGFSTSPPGLGLAGYAPCVGAPPGSPCPVELDAISWGRDERLTAELLPGQLWWSVDEFALGRNAASLFPSVSSEGVGGAQDAGAGAFTNRCAPPVPAPPAAPPAGNSAVFDGNGAISASGAENRGIGIFEPNFPGVPPDFGDNLDAMDVDTFFTPYPVYYSMDSAWPDPINGFPWNASAPVNGALPP